MACLDGNVLTAFLASSVPVNALLLPSCATVAVSTEKRHGPVEQSIAIPTPDSGENVEMSERLSANDAIAPPLMVMSPI